MDRPINKAARETASEMYRRYHFDDNKLGIKHFLESAFYHGRSWSRNNDKAEYITELEESLAKLARNKATNDSEFLKLSAANQQLRYKYERLKTAIHWQGERERTKTPVDSDTQPTVDHYRKKYYEVVEKYEAEIRELKGLKQNGDKVHDVPRSTVQQTSGPGITTPPEFKKHLDPEVRTQMDKASSFNYGSMELRAAADEAKRLDQKRPITVNVAPGATAHIRVGGSRAVVRGSKEEG